MLVKWAIEGRRKLAKISGSENGQASKPHPSATADVLKDQQQIAQLSANSETPAQSPVLTAEPDTSERNMAELDRLRFQSNAIAVKSSESNSDRAFRRIEAEEMASSLRNEKLLSLAGRQARSHSYQGSPATHALTQENLEKQLAYEGETMDCQRSSSNGAEPPSLQAPSIGANSALTRPGSLIDGRFDSERTITFSQAPE